MEVEDLLRENLGPVAEVDGHDFGSGTGNIYLFTDRPKEAFEQIRSLLDEAVQRGTKAAFSKMEEEEYTVLWPPTVKRFTIF
jgi:hypothetical protein